MEPHANSLERQSNTSPEQPGINPEMGQREKKLEHVPLGALEQLNDGAAEKSQASDNSLAATADGVVTIPTVPMPTTDDAAISDNTMTAQNPAVAADDDVIEKEWVNKAKRVINQTKGDPYAKELEVSKLQADYMQKRYGKQVKLPDET